MPNTAQVPSFTLTMAGTGMERMRLALGSRTTRALSPTPIAARARSSAVGGTAPRPERWDSWAADARTP